jgi:hypothetical protein
VLGVVIAPAEAKLPIPVSYATRASAGRRPGLGFALEIYSSLSRRPVVRGHRVAVTGEISSTAPSPRSAASSRRRSAPPTPGLTSSWSPRRTPPRRAAGPARAADLPVGTFAEALDALEALPAA